eukprot:TRINITY_DN1705_c0_g1_i7.p1 TRINITY_DN1705_c0_g1~~TRINITY_DN1705_c0_g1_i7.p1  ORF type:complete len:246 (-),score=58.05 TRINITY_DN1705_c0_g1_i7:134-871(-)
MDKLQSGAWPKGSKIRPQSDVHRRIASLNVPICKDDLVFRFMTFDDLPEFKALMDEWFPFTYSDNFYVRALTLPNYLFLACTWKPSSSHKSLIIGGIMAHFETNSTAFCYISNNSVTAQVSCCARLKNRLRNWGSENAYIGTIGVIDEARRLGVASQLIDLVHEEAKKRKKCVSLSLHVMKVNEQAIKCYERNGFVHVCDISDYYEIKGEMHDAKYYVKKVKEKGDKTLPSKYDNNEAERLVLKS